MKCIRITAARPCGSGPRSEMHLYAPLPTGDVIEVARTENHKAEWLTRIKYSPVFKKVEYISKSEYWAECAPELRAEHEARSAANKAREAETSK